MSGIDPHSSFTKALNLISSISCKDYHFDKHNSESTETMYYIQTNVFHWKRRLHIKYERVCDWSNLEQLTRN